MEDGVSGELRPAVRKRSRIGSQRLNISTAAQLSQGSGDNAPWLLVVGGGEGVLVMAQVVRSMVARVFRREGARLLGDIL